MNSKQTTIAVDIGTTSTKTMLIRADGATLDIANIGYPLNTPTPGAAEQDPDEIFEAVLQGMKQMVQSYKQSGGDVQDILCVSFSSAMHSLIGVDAQGRPLTQSLTWADQRAQQEADQLNAADAGLQIYKRTGTPIHPMSPLVKLIWLGRTNPEITAKVFKWIGIKEYVLFKLFGKYVVDYSIASATGLFDLQKLEWNELALQTAGVNKDQLPEPVPTTFCLTGLGKEFEAKLGIGKETPFVVGASDGVLANLGAGVMNTDRFAVSIGTSSAVRTVVERPALDAKGRLFCYCLTEKHWVTGGASNNGAIVLQWAMKALYATETEQWKQQGIDPFQAIFKEAEQVNPGADGLLFLPLLSGERAPFWDAQAKGVFFGLSLTHDKKHMLRAALEGVAFQVACIVDIMKETAGVPREIIASGGFAHSPLWCQILSDILGIKIVIPDEVNSSCLGAAQLGLMAIGQAESIDHSWETAQGQTYHPSRKAHAHYRQLLPIYTRIYHQMKESFAQISHIQPYNDASL